MGPIVLFDKSFLEMLNVDEAAVFDALYSTVICPIFYTEVLADLSKEPPGMRTVERIVADVARKTPIMHSTPNVLHSSLCLTELIDGYVIEMRGAPVLAGGGAGRKSDGGLGVFYDETPEAKAFGRWQRGRFHEVERDFASHWRGQLESADHANLAKLATQVLARIHRSRTRGNIAGGKPSNTYAVFSVLNRARATGLTSRTSTISRSGAISRLSTAT